MRISKLSKNTTFEENSNQVKALEEELANVKEALKESEKQQEKLTDQLLMGIAIFQDNQIVFVNKMVSEITGYPTEEIYEWKNVDFMKLIHPDDIPLILNTMKKSVDSKSFVSHQYRLKKKQVNLFG